jgi:hypothetical protein
MLRNNPYPILGFSTNLNDKEIQNKIDEIEVYLSIGKIPTVSMDIDWLLKAQRSKESIADALELIKDPELNIINKLLWFSNNDPNDNMAIDFIKKKKVGMGFQLWKNFLPKAEVKSSSNESINYKKYITGDNFHQIKNIACLYFLVCLGDKGEIKKLKSFQAKPEKYFNKSMELYYHLISSEYFLDTYAKKLKASKEINVSYLFFKKIKKILDLEVFNSSKTRYLENYTLSSFFNCLSTLDQQVSNDLFNESIKPDVQLIQEAINNYNDIVDEKTEDSDKIGLDLLKKTKPVVQNIMSLCSDDVTKAQTIIDRLAQTLLNASVNIWNSEDVNKGNKHFKNIIKIENAAKKIAISTFQKNKCDDSKSKLLELLEEKEVYKNFQPIYNLIDVYKNKKGLNNYKKAKSFAFELRPIRDSVEKQIQAEYKAKFFEHMDICGYFLKNLSLDLNNDSEEYGQATEILDFARRLFYLSGNSIELKNCDFQRSSLVNNISTKNRNIGLLGTIIGGIGGAAIRTARKNSSCGCNSGKNLQDCCSMSPP